MAAGVYEASPFSAQKVCILPSNLTCSFRFRSASFKSHAVGFAGNFSVAAGIRLRLISSDTAFRIPATLSANRISDTVNLLFLRAV